MKMTMEMKKNEVLVLPKDEMQEHLFQEELLHLVKINRSFQKPIFKGNDRNRILIKSSLSWDLMLHEDVDSIENAPALKDLQSFGVEIKGLEKAEIKYRGMKKKHDIFNLTLEEFKQTPRYLNAVDAVETLHATNLFGYQIECAANIVSRRRLLNAMDMGTGKTRSTIAGLTSDPRNKKILIVTMSRNIQDWVKEINALGFGDDYIELSTPNDMKSTKRIHLVSYERWGRESNTVQEQYKDRLITRCECGKSFEEGQHSCPCGFTTLSIRKKPLYKYFNRSYKAAAIDEGHLIKNGNTTRCKSIMAIKTPVRVLLSGTPAESGAADLFWPLAWLLGDNYHFWNAAAFTRFESTNFGERCFKYSFGGVDKTTIMDSRGISSRTSNVKELWALQDKVMFRKMKTDDDVKGAINVPKPNHRRLHLEQTEDEKKFYQGVLNDFSTWFAEMKEARKLASIKGVPYPNSSLEINVWLEKLRRAASCPWIMDGFNATTNEPSSKLKYVKEYMQKEASKKRKMLIFTAHKQTCEELGAYLDMVVPGYSVGYIHGSIPMTKRKELLARFQDENDDLSVLIMTMRTGAESYTLTEAKSVILWDLDYNAKKIEQCYSRAVRLGQTEEVEVVWLINIDTIDTNMHSLILSKTSSVDTAIDRKELDFTEIAKEFEGHGIAGSGLMDFESFASEMLTRGTSRKDYEVA